MTAPLDGVRVLEVAIYAFVPSATAILADWGADVLKVEHPVIGDPGRNTAAWGVPADVNGVSHLWEVANRGKRAMTLDIATPEGKEILLQLVDESDVFVTNFLPPARRKLGIEPEDIMGRNPRIIYARGSAQGPRGACVRAGRLRRHLVLGPHRCRHRRHPARARRPAGDARPRLRRPPVRRRHGRRHQHRAATSASGPARACSSTCRSCRWACGPWA